MSRHGMVIAAAALGLLLTAADARAQIFRAGDGAVLVGDYLGLANRGVGTTPFGVQMEIEQQDLARFLGIISMEQEAFDISGTIAASDKCKIVADGGADLALLLNWTGFGDGAAVLTGELTVQDGTSNTSGGVTLLRPFEKLDVDWGDGNARGTFQSHTGGANFGVPIDFLYGARGLFGAVFALGGEEFEIVGTSSTDARVVAVGVSDSFVMTIAGQVKINERGEPTLVEGTYLIETPRAKLVDAGTMEMELVLERK